MKKLIVLLLFLIGMTSCSNSPHWQSTRKANGNKYSMFKPGWPFENTCQTYSTQLPVKVSTYKKYHYHRQTKR